MGGLGEAAEDAWLFSLLDMETALPKGDAGGCAGGKDLCCVMMVLGGALKPLGLGSISILMVVEGATVPPGMEGCWWTGTGDKNWPAQNRQAKATCLEYQNH